MLAIAEMIIYSFYLIFNSLIAWLNIKEIDQYIEELNFRELLALTTKEQIKYFQLMLKRLYFRSNSELVSKVSLQISKMKSSLSSLQQLTINSF